MTRLFTSILFLGLVLVASAQTVNLNAGAFTYTQNFNTLALSGTSSSLPDGWFLLESGTGANTTYTAGTGSGNGGDTYSFGAASSTDRAIGGLQSGSVTPTFGVSLTNNTGTTITDIVVNYIGEQWRLGATGRVDRLDFQYSTSATSLNTGTWTDADALDFTAPITTGTAGAIDGNATANRTAKSFTITGLSIASGSKIWFRFNDLNATGSDDGLGVDDFSVTGTNSFYADTDGDTYGAGTALSGFAIGVGFSINNTDCNDGSAAANPNATEIADAIDNDCDGSIDEGFIDIQDPSANCQTSVTVIPNSVGVASFTTADINNGSSDDFGITSITVNPTSFTCIGGVTTLTVSDAAGHTATCTATVVVADIAPTAACNQTIPIVLVNGEATLTTAQVDAGSADACSTVALSLSKTNFDCADASTITTTPGLLITEYVEGSANNKYLEIFNGTGASVNLANYQLHLFTNGSSTATVSALSGTLAAFQTIVYKNSSAALTVPGAITSAAINFNGDDAIAIYNTLTSSYDDIFGNIGEDPGTAWTGTLGYTTLDRTLRRLVTVGAGVTTDPSGSGFPTLNTQWLLLPQNDVSDLGQHAFQAYTTTSVTLTVSDGTSTSTCVANIVVGVDCGSISPSTTVGTTTADITWPAITCGTGYTFRYRVVGGSWVVSTPTATGISLSGLTELTNYVFEASFMCANGLVSTTSGTFSTLGTFYIDADGDGFGILPVVLLAAPANGYVTVAGDCDDNNNLIFPGQTEDLCDLIDNNCDGTINEVPVGGSCPAPTDITATNITKSQAKINWLNACGVNSTRVQFRRISAPAQTIWTYSVANAPATSRLIYGLLAAKTYEYRLRNTCGGNISSTTSAAATFTTLAASMAQNEGNEAQSIEQNRVGNTEVRVYPNPAVNTVFIEASGMTATQANIRLFDASGRTLLQWNAPVSDGQIREQMNVSDLPTGLYMVRINGADAPIIRTLIVE